MAAIVCDAQAHAAAAAAKEEEAEVAVAGDGVVQTEHVDAALRPYAALLRGPPWWEARASPPGQPVSSERSFRRALQKEATQAWELLTKGLHKARSPVPSVALVACSLAPRERKETRATARGVAPRSLSRGHSCGRYR